MDFTYEHFSELCAEVSVKTSSPGLPWLTLGVHSVGDVFDKYRFVLYHAVKQRIQARIRGVRDGTLDEFGSEDLACGGFRDIVRLFVKNEPHSEKKITEGRFRLIMNSSLTDIMCDRVVAERLCAAEIAVWDKIPSKPGMGLDDENLSKFVRGCNPRATSSLDAKAWDWSLKAWLMKLCVRVESAQYGVSRASDLGCALYASAVVTMRKILVLADGSMYSQEEEGIQESGSRLTAARNSKCRVLLGLLAGALDVEAMGDDSKEEWSNGRPDLTKYEVMGFRMEEAELPPGCDFEFCSHQFYGELAVPLNWAKTLYRLLAHPPEASLAGQFKYDLRNSPMKETLFDYLRTTSWRGFFAER